MKKLWKETGRGLLVVLLLAAMLLPGAAPLAETAQAVTQSDIDALEDDAENLAKQRREVRAQLAELKDDYTVYPGHGESTTLAEEKRYNPYMR